MKFRVRIAIVVLAAAGAYALWRRVAGRADRLDDGPSPRRIQERSELTVEEWAVGSDNPVKQAAAILAESDERALLSPDADGIERRRSEDTVEP